MKKVIESVRAPTSVAYPGTAPMAKRAEPVANRMPIHQPRVCGAHQVREDPSPSACLR
jgi:hypothetical protein